MTVIFKVQPKQITKRHDMPDDVSWCEHNFE